MEDQAIQNVRFVGIDFGKGAYEAAILDDQGKIKTHSGIANAKGRQILYRKLCAQDTVALAAKSAAFTMAKEIETAVGCRVLMVDTECLGLTDEGDVAKKLARMVKERGVELLPAASPPDEGALRLRKMRASWQTGKHNRNLTLKRLHGLLVAGGMPTLAKQDLATAERRLAAVKGLNGFERQEAEHLLNCMRLYEEWIMLLEVQIKEECKNNEECGIRNEE